MVLLLPFFYMARVIKDTIRDFLRSCQDGSFEGVDFWEMLFSPLQWSFITWLKLFGLIFLAQVLIVVLFFVYRIVHPIRQVEHNGIGHPDPNLARRNLGVRDEPPPEDE
ncbi:unnamed protein product [Larinioides sclopetarius]|uniref:Uncharacterized protein n=1 Tax=Larinioides sclopetarius TaxID=280406 RepID=A0AAV2A1K1_9ARAC